eukprot:TRINITY_DN16681_c0_g1_i1.p1 TRINITY_DN16681_c0_g1~~TRINITY_DN16681_c0_g1_i1.p1  ORF type:complete len:786 (-),score=111.11 TRINITY_DN16681_c0_g1_i1:470-2827(-)
MAFTNRSRAITDLRGYAAHLAHSLQSSPNGSWAISSWDGAQKSTARRNTSPEPEKISVEPRHSIASSLDSRTPQLTETIEPELMRGVPLDRALSGWGKHWGGLAGEITDYALSEVTSALDDFISHDWRTGRWQKFIAICFIYNSKAAFAASVVLAMLIVILQLPAVNLLPRGVELDLDEGSRGTIPMQCSLFCPLVFFSVLFGFQRIKRLLGFSPQVAFVDKLCINQVDEEKKTAGILGLAAFLVKSRRMVLLWSPTYFSRLWCTYEVATWLYFEKDIRSGSLCVVPVAVTVGVVGFVTLEAFFSVGIAILKSNVDNDNLSLALRAVVSALYLGFTLHRVRPLQRQVKQLPQQIDNFNVRDTLCFCCTNDHIHPQTGATLPCDRKLVYRTLRKWYRVDDTDAGRVGEAYLDQFQEYVRASFKSIMQRHILCGQMQIGYWNCVLCAVGTFWLDCDYLVFLSHDPGMFCRQVLMTATYVLAFWPCIVSFAFMVMNCFDGFFGVQREGSIMEVLTTIAIFVFIFAVGLIYYGTGVFLKDPALVESPLPLICYSVFTIALTLALYGRSIPCLEGRHDFEQYSHLLTLPTLESWSYMRWSSTSVKRRSTSLGDAPETGSIIVDQQGTTPAASPATTAASGSDCGCRDSTGSCDSEDITEDPQQQQAACAHSRVVVAEEDVWRSDSSLVSLDEVRSFTNDAASGSLADNDDSHAFAKECSLTVMEDCSTMMEDDAAEATIHRVQTSLHMKEGPAARADWTFNDDEKKDKRVLEIEQGAVGDVCCSSSIVSI